MVTRLRFILRPQALASRRRSPSTEYLRLEIKIYRPKLIVLVTGDYAGGVVTAVFGEQGWQKERQRDGYWWRNASGRLPAVLWTYHPQRKSRGLVEKWLRQAVRLTTGVRVRST